MWNLLLPAAMGLMSANATKRKNEQMKQQNLAESEKTRYDFATGRGPGQINTNYGDPLSAALSGGLQGLAMNQAIGQAGGWGSLLGMEDAEKAKMVGMNTDPNKFGNFA